MPSDNETRESGGGAHIGGNVTVGGNFVGRDQHIQGNYKQSTRSGVESDDLAKLFEAVYGRISERSEDLNVDKDELADTVRRIEQEAAKGAAGSDAKIARWLTHLGDVAPDVLELAINALTSPGTAVASAIRLAARALSTPRTSQVDATDL